MAEPPDKEPGFSALRSAGLLLAIPTLLIVSPLVGFFIGSGVDRWLHSAPWFTIVGLILGFVTAGRETWVLYRRSVQEEEKNRRR
jgi:F0F1-type ATP synthase assembly protein I